VTGAASTKRKGATPAWAGLAQAPGHSRPWTVKSAILLIAIYCPEYLPTIDHLVLEVTMKLLRSFPIPCLALLLISVAAVNVKSDAGGRTETSRAINGSSSEEKPHASGVADDIALLRERWVKELHDKQLDEIISHYAPDAAFLSPGGRFTGPAAIRGLFKNVMDTVTSELTTHSLVTESSGDLAYDSGSYSETLVPVKGGPNQQFQGDYLTVFRRQKDGKWLIIQHVWTFTGSDIIPTAK
jgi:ketosteroid isomerase-like protein